MAADDTLFAWHPDENEPGVLSNPATPGAQNGHPTLDFDDTTNEDAVFSAVMPEHYGGGGIDVEITGVHPATTGDVDADGAFERVGETQDIDSDSFATAQSSDNNSVSGTAGVPFKITISFSSAQIDGILAGEKFRFKVTRDAGTDTASGDWRVLAVHGIET